MAMRRVVVTGLGCTSPLGVGVKKTWTRLLQGHSGIISLRDHKSYDTIYDISHQQCQIAGIVPPAELSQALAQYLTPEVLAPHFIHLNADQSKEIHRSSNFMQHALIAAQEALLDANWQSHSESESDRAGICLGSGIGSLETLDSTSRQVQETGSLRKVSPLFVPKLLVNLAAGHISIKHDLRGPAHAASTACATGAHSIGDAARFIQFGDADLMLAGGAEACIHPLAFAGFEKSRSLTTMFNHAPTRASRPFDQLRSGFVIGEGAAVLVLEELECAKARGARIYAEVCGYGASSDAWHLTAPPPDGNGALRAMQSALRQANLKPADVSYINAHATGTVLGDVAELRAIACLMESSRLGSGKVSVSSTKGALGHLLGAAGAIEALFCALAIHADVVPPTLNLEAPESVAASTCNFVVGEKLEAPVDVVLSNSFGFGGSNASLCFRKYKEL